MPAERVVIFPKGGEGTKSMRKVVEVGVVQGDCLRAAVKAGCRKYAVRKVVLEVRVFEKKSLQGLGKVPVQLWGKCCKGA
jgi:hypothetical protein